MDPAEYDRREAVAVDPMHTRRKVHTVMPGQFNVTLDDVSKELEFEVDTSRINFGGIGEGCSDPQALKKMVNTPTGPRYFGMQDNTKLWYTREAAEMLFHQQLRPAASRPDSRK